MSLEDFSRTRQAQRYLAVDRLPKSTPADFHRLVDPAVLEPVVGHLLAETVAGGGATAEEVFPILVERERRCALDRESQRRRRARQAEAESA